MSRSDLHKVTVSEVKAVTDLGVLCEIDGDDIWLPLSQCWDGGAENWSPVRGDRDVDIEIPEWLAEEKGIA